jgi:hypothetical protein
MGSAADAGPSAAAGLILRNSAPRCSIPKMEWRNSDRHLIFLIRGKSGDQQALAVTLIGEVAEFMCVSTPPRLIKRIAKRWQAAQSN